MRPLVALLLLWPAAATADERCTEPHDQKGELHGEVKCKQPWGPLDYVAHYNHGKLDGVKRSFLETDASKIKSEEMYKNGQLDGPSRFYSSAGDLKEERNYKQGEKDGEQRTYH